MVKLEEVPEGHEIIEEEDDGLSDAESAYSSDSSSSEYEESILERLRALRDIIPQDTRESISSNVSMIWNYGWTGATFIGNAMWILTTTALLVVMPLALELEREQAIVQMENEQKALMNQQGGATTTNQTGQPQQNPRTGLVPPGY